MGEIPDPWLELKSQMLQWAVLLDHSTLAEGGKAHGRPTSYGVLGKQAMGREGQSTIASVPGMGVKQTLHRHLFTVYTIFARYECYHPFTGKENEAEDLI